jgi:inorganic pyrophosphatase
MFMLINNNHKMSETSSNIIKVIVEIERHSNKKWEYDRSLHKLYLDRVLKYPYFYPYAYGFVPDSLGKDGDELDILLITDKHYPNFNESPNCVEGYIVGGLAMQDEKGEDDKIFVVPVDEIGDYLNKSESEIRSMQDDIVWFFSNYKLKEEGRWSRVHCLMDKKEAIIAYRRAIREHVRQSLEKLQKSL